MYRKTWFEINLDALEQNMRTIRKICGKRFICVLKADGYGCGDEQVARTALKAGAQMFAVSSLDEAVMLRKKGFTETPILILGATDPGDVPVLIRYDVATAGLNLNWVKEVVQQDCRGLKVHIAVDTGMNRIGFDDLDQIREGIALLKSHGAEVPGIFTHFCTTDCDLDKMRQQYDLFAETVKALPDSFAWIHCDNSDASIMFRDDLSNAFRLGISMYGFSDYKKDLAQPLAFYSTLSMVKKVYPGETIGYGATYTCQQEEWIGTVPAGYADGIIRANQGRKVYVNGSYCEIVGRVCMDQLMIRLPEELPAGTKVEFFGPHIRLDAMAAELHTIPHEIMCLIAPRVTRIYTRSGAVVAEENARLSGADNA